MQFKLRLLLAAAVAVTLAACGGGSATGPSTAKTSTSGVAVDGYLSFAKVVCDANGNGIADAGEAVVFTDAKGNFSFPGGCAFGIFASGGLSYDTQLPFVGILKAPAGATVVSPLTSLLAAGMTQAQINSTLDLPPGTDLLNTDPGLTDSKGALVNAELMKKALAVQQLLQKATEAFAGLAGATGSAAVQPIYNEVVASFAAQLKTGVKLNSSDTEVDLSVVKALVTSAAQRVAASADVLPAVKTALTGVSAKGLGEVIGSSLKLQSDAILQSTDSNITAVTKANQGSEDITSFVQVNASQISGTASTATLAALGTTLNQQVVATATPTPPSTSVLVSFDEAIPAFSDMGAYGGAQPDVVAGPSGGNGKALKIVKPVNPGTTWGGVFFGVSAIPFTADRKTITARVYSTRANAVIKFKVQVTDSDFVEVASAPTGAANTWSTATWTFTGISTSKQYKTIAITPDVDTVTTGQTYYIDEITLAPAGAAAPPPSTEFALSFDEVPPAFSGMGAYGGALPDVVAGPTGGRANALKIVKPVNPGTTWGGVFFTVSAIPFTADRKTMTARVYSTVANAVINLKVQVTDTDFVEVASASTGAANTWSTATWVFSAVDPGKAYTVMAITPDVNTVTTGQTYYVDDITLAPATSGPVVTVPTTAAPTPPARLASDVVSIYSDAYASVAGLDLFPNWGQKTVVTEVMIAGNKTQKYANLDYEGIQFNTVNVSAMTNLHIDVWTADATPFNLSIISTGPKEQAVSLAPTKSGWNSFDIDLSKYTVPNKADIFQLKFDGAPANSTLYFDNLYFWKPATTVTNYLALTGDALAFNNGSTTTSFSMSDFQSTAGISVKWPMASNASIVLNLYEVGSFTLAPGQKITGAVQISEMRSGGLGEIRGYIDNVSITKTGNRMQVTVPNPADALIYGVSGDGTKKALINFSASVAGITNSLTAAAGTLNSILIGDVVSYAVNQVSNDFTGINSLRGKYKLTVVVTDLPLRTTDGSVLKSYTIQVPTSIGSGGVPGNIKPVTGPGLEGYITLTD